MPWLNQSELIGKLFRIPSRWERFGGQNRGSRMMAVRQPVFRAETGHDNIRPKTPDYPDDVGKDFVVIPKSQRLFRVFGKPEIDCAGEKLLPVIDPSCRQKFLRPDKAEFFT